MSGKTKAKLLAELEAVNAELAELKAEDGWQSYLAERRSTADIDLGDDHYLHWMASQQGEQRIGATIMHRAGPKGTETGWCIGGIQFAGTQHQRDYPEQPYWNVESYDPLTINPSVRCSCGDHGLVRGGKWVRA